jgi:hypothetical protein
MEVKGSLFFVCTRRSTEFKGQYVAMKATTTPQRTAGLLNLRADATFNFTSGHSVWFRSSLAYNGFHGSVCAGAKDSLATAHVLTFGSTTISATRFHDSSSLDVTKPSASNEYQHYYRGVLHELMDRISYSKNHVAYYKWMDHESEVTMFCNEAAMINASLKNQLGHIPIYAAVILPPLFDLAESAAEQAFFRLVVSSTSSEFGIRRRGTFLRIACGGFGAFQYKHVGRTSI